MLYVMTAAARRQEPVASARTLAVVALSRPAEFVKRRSSYYARLPRTHARYVRLENPTCKKDSLFSAIIPSLNSSSFPHLNLRAEPVSAIVRRERG